MLRGQLAEHERQKEDNDRIMRLVFHRNGNPSRDRRTAWESACKTGSGRVPHDFRRTAVHNLERAGVPRAAAMAMVGHKTESVHRRYAIVDASVLRDAAARIDREAASGQ